MYRFAWDYSLDGMRDCLLAQFDQATGSNFPVFEYDTAGSIVTDKASEGRGRKRICLLDGRRCL